MSAPESIFVCYRRSDSADAVDRIYEVLEKDFSRRGLFRDIDSVPVGIDFRSHIIRVLESCSVVLVIIGPGWLDARTQDGHRRLEDPLDHVRVEIETALRVEGLRIIPVLVRDASVPKSDQLPDSIQALVGRSSLSIRPNPDFRGDMSRLVRDLREAIAEIRQLRSEPIRGSQGPRAHRQSQSKTTPARTAQYGWLRSIAQLSFVPFVLVLLSCFLPFWADPRPGYYSTPSGFSMLLHATQLGPWLGYVGKLLGAFLCLILVLISSFLKYRWKRVLEAIVSWISFIMLVFVFDFVPAGAPYHPGLGYIFACIFAAAGGIMKTCLLIYGRKLEA